MGGNTDKNYLSSLPAAESDERETIWDAFNTEATREPVKVNRYIWQAALDVLDFMPIETIDPFSGVIVKGFGVPPGGKTHQQHRRAWRTRCCLGPSGRTPPRTRRGEDPRATPRPRPRGSASTAASSCDACARPGRRRS